MTLDPNAPNAIARMRIRTRRWFVDTLRSPPALGAVCVLLLHLFCMSMPAGLRLLTAGIGIFAILLRTDKLVFMTIALSFAAAAANRILFADWTDVLRFQDVVGSISLLAYVLLALRSLEWSIQPSPPFHLWSGVAWRLAASLGIALTLLLLLPLSAMVPNRFGILAAPMRTILIFWMVMGIASLAAAVLSILKWRRLTPAQAALFCRGEWSAELRSELTSIEKKRGSFPPR